MRRSHRTRIVATLGPASSSAATIRALFVAGADAFRLNFSYGTRAEHAASVAAVRQLEAEFDRPTALMLDLQGPKLRLGDFVGGYAHIEAGARLRIDMNPAPGNSTRAPLPHAEVFAALRRDSEVLVDEGRLRLRVEAVGEGWADTRVLTGGRIADRKGVNLPGLVLPMSSLTAKDRADLDAALGLGVDWIALSHVQCAEDVARVREIVGCRAWIMAKIERPSAVDDLDRILALADGLLVARGDLGVELPPEDVPEVQRRVLRACRDAGKPAAVATQMLESMVHAATPTRAEVSDVATAVYDGADAVVLAAETAIGEHPVAALQMTQRIIAKVESSPSYRGGIDAARAPVGRSTPDAVCSALSGIVRRLDAVALVAYTVTGTTALQAARERPAAPILGLTSDPEVARRLALVWGVHAVLIDAVHDLAQMVRWATRIAVIEGLAGSGDEVVIVAGLPFGEAGCTNLIHVARLPGSPAAKAAEAAHEKGASKAPLDLLPAA